MKLNLKALALTFGLIEGFGFLFLTWWLIALHGPGIDAGILGVICPGYEITALGSVIGLLWGFADGCIGGVVIAWLYNKFAARFSA